MWKALVWPHDFNKKGAHKTSLTRSFLWKSMNKTSKKRGHFRGIDVLSFYDFDIWFLDSSDIVLFYFFFILFRYDVLLITISNCANCISLIHHNTLRLPKTASSASFLDIVLIFDNNSHISTRLYNKGDNFHFGITNFQHLDSNIQVTLSYELVILQLIRYDWACTLYSDFS